MNTYIHIYIKNTHAHIYIHTQIHALTYIHTHTQVREADVQTRCRRRQEKKTQSDRADSDSDHSGVDDGNDDVIEIDARTAGKVGLDSKGDMPQRVIKGAGEPGTESTQIQQAVNDDARDQKKSGAAKNARGTVVKKELLDRSKSRQQGLHVKRSANDAEPKVQFQASKLRGGVDSATSSKEQQASRGNKANSSVKNIRSGGNSSNDTNSSQGYENRA